MPQFLGHSVADAPSDKDERVESLTGYIAKDEKILLDLNILKKKNGKSEPNKSLGATPDEIRNFMNWISGPKNPPLAPLARKILSLKYSLIKDSIKNIGTSPNQRTGQLELLKKIEKILASDINYKGGAEEEPVDISGNQVTNNVLNENAENQAPLNTGKNPLCNQVVTINNGELEQVLQTLIQLIEKLNTPNTNQDLNNMQQSVEGLMEYLKGNLKIAEEQKLECLQELEELKKKMAVPNTQEINALKEKVTTLEGENAKLKTSVANNDDEQELNELQEHLKALLEENNRLKKEPFLSLQNEINNISEDQKVKVHEFLQKLMELAKEVNSYAKVGGGPKIDFEKSITIGIVEKEGKKQFETSLSNESLQADLDKEKTNVAGNIAAKNIEIASLQQQLTQLRQEKEANIGKNVSLESELSALKNEKATFVATIADLESQLEQIRIQKNANIGLVRSNAQTRAEELQRIISDLQGQLEKAQTVKNTNIGLAKANAQIRIEELEKIVSELTTKLEQVKAEKNSNIESVQLNTNVRIHGLEAALATAESEKVAAIQAQQEIITDLQAQLEKIKAEKNTNIGSIQANTTVRIQGLEAALATAESEKAAAIQAQQEIITDLQAQLEKVKAEKNTNIGSIQANTTVRIQGLEAALATAESEKVAALQAQQEIINDLQAQVETIKAQKNANVGSIQANTQMRITDLENALAEANTEKENIEKLVETHTATIAALETELEKVRSEKNANVGSVRANAQMRLEELEERLANVAAEKNAALETSGSYQTIINDLKTEIENIKAEKAADTELTSTLRTELATAEALKVDALKAVEIYKDTLEKWQARMHQLESFLANANQEKSVIQQQLEAATHKITELQIENKAQQREHLQKLEQLKDVCAADGSSVQKLQQKISDLIRNLDDKNNLIESLDRDRTEEIAKLDQLQRDSEQRIQELQNVLEQCKPAELFPTKNLKAIGNSLRAQENSRRAQHSPTTARVTPTKISPKTQTKSKTPPWRGGSKKTRRRQK